MSQLRNKFLKLFLAAGLILTAISGVSAVDISTCSDLSPLPGVYNSRAELQNDIDCNGQNIDMGDMGNSYTLDGNGYTVENFVVNRSASEDSAPVGMIGLANGEGKIVDITFANAEQNIDGTFGSSNKAFIAGDIEGNFNNPLYLQDVRVENVTVDLNGDTYDGYGLLGGNSDGRARVSNVVVKNVHIETDDSQSSFTIGEGAGGGIEYESVAVVDSSMEETQDDQNEYLGIFGHLGATSLTNTKAENITFSGSANDPHYTRGAETLTNSFVADTNINTLDERGPPDTFNNFYYNSENTGLSKGTGLTTSEMTGSGAVSTMSLPTNIWADTNQYPTFLFTLTPQVTSVDSPSENAILNQGASEGFNFSVNTGGQSTTVELKVTYPNGTEITEFSESLSSGTSKDYNIPLSFSDTGDYSWVVDVGTDISQPRSFEVIDYSQPAITLNSPVSQTESGYNSQKSVEFDFDIDNAQVSGNYTVQVKNSSEQSYNDLTTGTFSTGDNQVTTSANVDFPSSGTQDKDWRVVTEDQFDTLESSPASFTVERLVNPSISIEVPSEGEIFYTDSGSTVQVPFEGWVNNSQESGEAFAKATKDDASQFETSLFSDSIGTVSTGDQFVSGDLLVETGDYRDGRISVNFNSGATFSSNSVNFEVRDGTPQIDTYNVTSDEVSNLENIKAGDYFDITLEGTKTASDIDYIQYKIASPTQSFEVFQREPNYQDSNIYTDSVDNAFQMKGAWEGKTLNIDAQVFDVEGRQSDTQRVQVQTGTPPENFLLNSPNIGEFFLIPEGQNDVEVNIDYGVDSSELAGDLKLYVNGQQQATQSVGSNTQQTFTYTDTYTEGTQTWYLEWTDSTGETYTSSTSNFEVSQYPLGLSLDSPSQGESVQIDSEPGTVDHSFTVSSDAFTGDWYYEFRLTNGNDTVVEETTSEVFSGVTQQFTETADGVEEGSYTYNVSVYDDSDNSQIITKSKSYDTVFDPLFNQEIDSPGNGNTYLVQPGETRNVSYGFSVETFDDATDFTLSLDGTTVTTESVGTQSSDTFTGDFTGLGTGTYSVELTGEDSSGRTNSTSVSFSVEEAESENESVDINTIEFTPSLDEARPGDELDVYIEGSGTPDNVDYVEIELDIAGDTETIIVPTDELQEGSWFWSGNNVVTVKESWAGATAKVTGTVTDVAGRTSRFFREYVLGSELEMFGVLETPRNGEVYLRDNGTDRPIEFTGEVRAGFDNIVYEVQANDQNLFGGSLSPEESTEFSQFVAPSQWTLDQFGEYKATLLLTNSETNEQKSYTNTFEIVEDTGQPVVTISDPGQNAQIETPRGENDADVTLRYRIQTNQSGTTSLILENLDEGRQEINIGDIDEQVSDQEASSGEAFRTVDTTLDKGTYLMRASFEDNSGQNASRERTFKVVEEAYEPEEEVNVSLVEPQEGEEIPQNLGTNIEWQAVHDQGVGVPNSTFYVEDSGDNIVYTDTRDAPNSGEGNVYSGYLDADLDPGDYQFYADLKLESQTLETQKRNLTVLDSQAPETSLQNQDLGTFRQGEDGVADIEAEFSTETFQQDVTLELVTRPEGSNDGTVRLTAQQEGFREISRNASWNEFEPGEYEYYVRMEANPTYTSDTGTYTVEKTEFDDPLIQLDRPEQGETFTYNDTNASVPFRFDAEAYTQSQTNFTLLLETVSEDNSELESIDSFTLNEEDGLREYSENFELEESGYRYQVIAEYEDETWSSDTRSFVVDNEETVDTPEMPTAGEGFGIISRISDFGERLLGNQSDFILGFGLLLITSVGVTVRTRSDKIGLATMVGVALGLSYVGVFPSWIAAVFTLIAVGISVWTVNLLVGGKGEL